jgi:multiphosphoryl transfer protein
VGLFRTEFLFMERTEAPTEEEQYQAYIAVASALNGYPVIIRTLDVGGDKPIPYLTSAQEENPFLGHRGIRNWLDAPALARTQLRAICRASHDYKIKVMFPMVSTVEEVRRAKKILAEIQTALTAEGIGYNRGMEVGIMIEVPAAVWSADALAREVDFFSIGTNDLTQYIMAADRGNTKVSGLATYFQPAVLQAIQQVVRAARTANIPVGMCGEMAGNPVALPLLVGLGLDELSMSAPAIPEIKAKIRELSLEKAETIARHILTLPTAEAVQTYLSER